MRLTSRGRRTEKRCSFCDMVGRSVAEATEVVYGMFALIVKEGSTARWVAIRVFLITVVVVVVVVFCARKLKVYTEVNTGVAIGEASRGADACARDWASSRKEGLAKSKYRGPK